MTPQNSFPVDEAGNQETRVQEPTIPTVSTADMSKVDKGQDSEARHLSINTADGHPIPSQSLPAIVPDAPPLTPASTTTTASRPFRPGPTSSISPTSPRTTPLSPALSRSFRAVERDLTHLSLTPTPTPKQMSDHLKRFNALLAEAVDLGRPVDDLCRAEWFLDSLPLDFEYLRLHYDTLPSGEQGWGALKGLFQGEVKARQRRADREARLLSEGEVLKRGADMPLKQS